MRFSSQNQALTGLWQDMWGDGGGALASSGCLVHTLMSIISFNS